MRKSISSVAIAIFFALAMLLFGSQESFAAERLRFGVVFKFSPNFAWIEWATEEKKLWEKYGFDTEWLGFQFGGDMHRALAAGALDMGLANTTGAIEAIVNGVPEIIIGDFPAFAEFVIWVTGDSPLKQPQDLKGRRIGIGARADAAYAYAIFAIRSVGLTRKDVKFVGVGGLPARLAALKAGVVDAFPVSLHSGAGLWAKGEVKPLIFTGKYLPKVWSDMVFVAHKDFVKKNPDAVKRGLSVVLDAIDFIRGNPSWAKERVKAKLGFSDKAAEIATEQLYPKAEDRGKLTPEAMKNVADFMVEYELISKDKLPPLDKLYITDFTG